MERILKAREGAPVSRTETLHHLSKFLPSAFQLFRPDDEVNRLSSYLPYIPCQINVYIKKSTLKCLENRYNSFGKPLVLAFVGDSQIRNVLEEIIVHLEPLLDFSVHTETGRITSTKEFVGHATKQFVTINSTMLIMELYWAETLREKRDMGNGSFGMIEIFERWADALATGMGSVPDIIYFGGGNWPLIQNLAPFAVDSVIKDLMLLRKHLSVLSKEVVLLLRTPTPWKPWARSYLKVTPNAALDFISQVGALLVKGTGVISWDTPTPVYLKEFDECVALWKTGKVNHLPQSWMCNSNNHFSQKANSVAANMIWNLLCNSISKVDSSHCCA